MQWSVYRTYESSHGAHAPSMLATAFEQRAQDFRVTAASDQTVITSSDSSLNDHAGPLEFSGHTTPIAIRVQNLFNQGHIGKAVDLLTHTLYEGKNVDTQIAELSQEVATYLQTHLSHEVNQLSDLMNAMRTFAAEAPTYVEEPASLGSVIKKLKFGKDEDDKSVDVEESLETIEQGVSGVASLNNETMDQPNNDKSQAQITAIMAAAQSLQSFVKSQEFSAEKTKQKQPDWYVAQQEQKKQDFILLPLYAA